MSVLGAPDAWVEARLHAFIIAGNMDRDMARSAYGAVTTPKAALMILQVVLKASEAEAATTFIPNIADVFSLQGEVSFGFANLQG